MNTLTDLTEKESLTDLTDLTGPVGKGGKGVRVTSQGLQSYRCSVTGCNRLCIGWLCQLHRQEAAK